ncbi:MAG: hypothetical protein QW201_01040 [Thermoproteota archaeon]
MDRLSLLLIALLDFHFRSGRCALSFQEGIGIIDILKRAESFLAV